MNEDRNIVKKDEIIYDVNQSNLGNYNQNASIHNQLNNHFENQLNSKSKKTSSKKNKQPQIHQPQIKMFNQNVNPQQVNQPIKISKPSTVKQKQIDESNDSMYIKLLKLILREDKLENINIPYMN